MYFGIKNYLKNNHNHTSKDAAKQAGARLTARAQLIDILGSLQRVVSLPLCC